MLLIERAAMALCIHDIDLGGQSREEYWRERPRHIRQRCIDDVCVVLTALREPDSHLTAAGNRAVADCGSLSHQSAIRVWQAIVDALIAERP